VATIIRRVLDWQLDLLDHTQLHTITVYTLYDSQQLSLFSCSEDCCSNSATTAATNSYGVPCHYSPTGATPLSNTLLTNCWTRNSLSTNSSQSHITTDDQSVSVSWFRVPSGAHDQMLIIVWQLLFFRYRTPPSDERSGLSFVLVTWTASAQYSKFVAGPRQLSISPYL
jgi:hypothetical protein